MAIKVTGKLNHNFLDCIASYVIPILRNNLTAWNGGDDLVLAIAAQNNNTIVVVHSVGPLILESWIQHPNVTAVCGPLFLVECLLNTFHRFFGVA